MNQQERLWKAAESGDCAEIRRAVISGADPSMPNEHGLTALNIASHKKHADAIRTLLAARQIADLARFRLDAEAAAPVAKRQAGAPVGAALPDEPVGLELEPEEDARPVFEEEPRRWWVFGRSRRRA